MNKLRKYFIDEVIQNTEDVFECTKAVNNLRLGVIK